MQPAGVLYALLAFGGWGFAPIYWKALDRVPAPEVLAHRVVWTALLAALLLAGLRRQGEVGDALRDRRARWALLGCALLIGANWLVFIWAVQNERILETSLGYYLNPLLSVLLGTAVLGERLRRAQGVSVALAALGVAVLVAGAGGVPWVSLALASSFAAYGLLRKLCPARPIPAVAIETALLAPLALAWLALGVAPGAGAFVNGDAPERALLIGAGPVTALPLLFFASAARRLALSVLGLFQYLAPSITFVLAVALYGEPFTGGHAVAFSCIWAALAITAWEGLRRPLPSAPPAAPRAERA